VWGGGADILPASFFLGPGHTDQWQALAKDCEMEDLEAQPQKTNSLVAIVHGRPQKKISGGKIHVLHNGHLDV